MTLTATDVKARAAELGFVACGITDLAPSIRAAALTRWLERGYGGNMWYLNRQAKKRKDLRLIDRTTTRAIVILDNYYYRETTSLPNRPRTAMYGRSTDYHIVTLNRINILAELLRNAGARTARPYVDTGPVPERELAERAGLGWIGKNTMLLRPGRGSWFVIGTIFTGLPLDIDPPIATDHCGSCTRCLDACPTDAFVEPYVLDATRCISYLTIEYKAEVPAELAGEFGGWTFGCGMSATRSVHGICALPRKHPGAQQRRQHGGRYGSACCTTEGRQPDLHRLPLPAMKTFIIVFILAILFVVGSAGAMRYLDRRIPKKKDDDHQP